MSTQFLLEETDIDTLLNLLLRSQQSRTREALCFSIGIDPKRLSFIRDSSESDFFLLLISYLNEIGEQEALCKLCCKELSPIFQHGKHATTLSEIAAKLDCNQRLSQDFTNNINNQQQTVLSSSPAPSVRVNPFIQLAKNKFVRYSVIVIIGLVGLAGFSIDKTPQVIVAIIGAVSAVVGALIQTKFSSQTAQPKYARLRQIIFGAVVGLALGVNIGLVAVNTINLQEPRMSSLEYNIDRPGEDYNMVSSDILLANPRICADACAKQSKCQAWTYIKPGFRDNDPYCFLKKNVPEKKSNPCCISGLKQ